MKDWYTYLMMAMVGGVAYVNLSGGGANDGVKARLTPGDHNVRNNPGSYRSHYTHSYVYIGGK